MQTNTIAQLNRKQEVRGLKSEARNPKIETISNVQNTNSQGKKPHYRSKDVRLSLVEAPALISGNSDFESFGSAQDRFVSDFDIRI